MTSSVSYARGRRIFNSLVTTASLVGLGVVVVILYANTSNSEKAAISSNATQRLSQPVISDAGPFASVPESTDVPRLSQPLPLKQAAASSHASRQWNASYRVARIRATCNGSSAAGAGANFRQYPAMDARVILGVVEAGNPVWVTGQRIKTDGVVWYAVTNPMLLAPSIDPRAQNKLNAYQFGWIADCFL